MKKLVTAFLSVFVIVNMQAKAQTATKFQINAIYGKGNVAYYPDNVFWITKSAFTAKAYPVEGTLWDRFYYPGTEPTVKKTTFDSLLTSFNDLTSKFNGLSTRFSTLESKQLAADTSNQTSTFKISQLGYSLLKVVDNKTIIVRSLIPGDDYDFQVTDSTIKPIKKH